MGKGTILRVLEGTVLTPALTRKLNELFPGYILEQFQAKPDFKQSIERRIKSLHEAFLFILDAYPLDPHFTSLTKQTLIDFAANALASCELNSDSLTALHPELEKFTTKLLNALVVAWPWSSDAVAVKESIACLNEAEQYVIMRRGRPDTATLTSMDFDGEPEFLLQLDRSLPPYYDLLLHELSIIKTKGFPKTPAWFRKLSEAEQAYLCNLTIDEVTPDTVISDIDLFAKNWERIKANSLKIRNDLDQIHRQQLPLPVWYQELSLAFQELIKALPDTPNSIDTTVQKLKQMLIKKKTEKTFISSLEDMVRVPQWYSTLSERQQCFLQHAINGTDEIEDAISFLSSRHRTLPAPANFGAHRLMRINSKGEVRTLSPDRFRSSHIASRDGLSVGRHGTGFPLAVQQRHSDANLARVIAFAAPGQKILLQTLISPIYIADYVPSVVSDRLPELPPDLSLYKLARAAVSRSNRSLAIWQHNHPFNYAKRYYYTPSDDKDSVALLNDTKKMTDKIDALKQQISSLEQQIADLELLEPALQKPSVMSLKENLTALRAQLPSFHQHVPALTGLVEDYKAVLESPIGTATVWDYVGRELFLSSLEHLITFALDGFSYGSCVSGKDRKAIEIIHTDAMLAYKERYGIWPRFNDELENRTRFVSIVVDIYMSYHQHVLAGQNAPGSVGIKTPYWYLPNDICTEINRRLGRDSALKDDDRLASDNEVKNIFSSYALRASLIPATRLLATLVAQQLGEKSCRTLYDALLPLINEKQLFQVERTVETWSLRLFDSEKAIVPTGIIAIKTLMHKEDSGSDNVHRMANIIEIVLNRPERDQSRKPATQAVYDGIRALCYPTALGVVVPDELAKKWTGLFQASKAANSSNGADTRVQLKV